MTKVNTKDHQIVNLELENHFLEIMKVLIKKPFQRKDSQKIVTKENTKDHQIVSLELEYLFLEMMVALIKRIFPRKDLLNLKVP